MFWNDGAGSTIPYLIDLIKYINLGAPRRKVPLMLHSLRPLATLVFLCLAQEALAGYRGNISFDLADQDRHLQGIQTIMKRASQCLREDLSRHQEFLKRFGISAFYGDNSSFAKKIVRGPDGREIRVSTSPEEKRNMLRSYGIGESLLMDFVPAVSCFSVGENPVPLENPAFRDQCRLALRPTSCIGLSLKCLGEGFHAAGQDDLWNQILQFTVENGVQGDALQVALQKLGWRIAYWNPDLSEIGRAHV